MQQFLPWHGLIGGLLIGLSAAFLLLAGGRMSGISGIVENTLKPREATFNWSLAYLIGLPMGALFVTLAAPALVPAVAINKSWPLLAVAGLLVGFGARVGGGCTSGHGVCGIPRLSPRSIVATITFMAAAMATLYVARHILKIA
jgi:uncharacterized protein